MTPDPIESPLATRTRVSGAGSHSSNHAGGAAHSAERALFAALERPPLQREWLALEAWFQALDAVDQAAVVAGLARRVHQEFVPAIKASVGSESLYDPGYPSGAISSTAAGTELGDAAAGAAAPGSAGSNSHRAELFDNFADLARGAGRQTTAPPPQGVDQAAAGGAGGDGSQNRFRSFRSLGSSQAPAGGSSPFVNSFISPVPKSGLYSQAFAPLGQRQQPFTPWSLSQEINRPKSAAEINPSSSPNYSPYQSHPWGQSGGAGSGYGSSQLDLMRSGQPGSESKLQPVSKRWTASPLRPKTGPTGATSGGSAPASAGNAPASPAPGAVGQGADAAALGGPAAPSAGPIGPMNPAPGAAGGDASAKCRDDKVWNGKPFQPTYAAVSSPTATPAAVVSPPATAAVLATSPSSLGAPVSPRAANLSPYPKRSVNYMDIELLADMGAWLRSLRLHKYTENLSDIPWQEVVLLGDEDLEARGVNALGARRKMLKMFEEIRAAQDTGKLPKD